MLASCPRGATVSLPYARGASAWTRTTGLPLRLRPTSALLVGDAGAGGAGERHDLNLAKAGVATPPGKLCARVIEGVAELDQHIQRHHQPERILAPGIVDQVLDHDERPPFRQRVVC